MDEKTEELRDIFLDVADEETVTDHQEDSRGSLESDRDIEAELLEVLAEMRSRYDFESDFDDEQLMELVNKFYDGDDDDTLAEEFEVDQSTIVEARRDLHLIRSSDRDAPFDLTAAWREYTTGTSIEELCDKFDVDEDTMQFHLEINETDQRSRQVNQRFRDAFDSILAEMELTTRMVRDVHEDGLDDATEGLESNVSF